MKTLIIICTAITLCSFTLISVNQISDDDLLATCKVLSLMTNQALDDDRKDLVIVFYNAYQGISSYNSMPKKCDDYFSSIQNEYVNDVGSFSVGLDFPPKPYSTQQGGFTHREIQTLNKIREMNLTLEDLEQTQLFKQIEQNTIDVELLKSTNTQEIQQLNENLNKLNLNQIDENKLNSLPNEKLQIEQFQQRME